MRGTETPPSMRARPTLNSIRLVRTIRRKSRAHTSICGPGSNGWCTAPSVFLRRNIGTIRSLGCASFAMNVDEPYETGSTRLRHPPCNNARPRAASESNEVGGAMNATYRAIEVSKPGQFSDVRKPLLDPGPQQVRIRVEACGVCHSDSGTVEGLFPIRWPRVPGHEVVGRIDAFGPGVQGWAVGQRVGVGFLGGACGYCAFCRNGDLVNCRNQEFTGIHSDGGYAEMMIAKASGLMAIPDDLSSANAAPLLCAGLTTFNALRNAPAKAGDLVAVLGIGGLGHLGVQYARHMGFEVAAIA